MAQPTNTFDSYDSKGNREDLRDAIYDISPTDTPFMTNCGTAKATNRYHEWQTDSLAAAVDSNAVVEGDNVGTDSRAATTRVGNYTQISDKVALVSGTVEAVDRAGRDGEMAYQMAKSAKELKRDMESSLTANKAQVAGDATTARVLGGLGSWIATNDVFQTDGSPTVGASPTGTGVNARTDNSSLTALSEANLNTAIRNAWTQGGEPNMIMCGPVNKSKITAFVGNASKYKNVDDRKIVNAVDLYVSDFGELSVVPNRYQRERDVFVLDMDMWDVAYLRDFKQKELASDGDYERRLINVEYTLVSKNEKASAGVFDCTTS